MEIKDLAIGQNVQIRYWNGDAFTGVVEELQDDSIGVMLDMCMEYVTVQLSKEWIDTIEEK